MNVIKPDSEYFMGGYRVLTLPAKHSVTEDAMLFYVERDGRGYLHMHDTGLPEDGIYAYLAEHGAKAYVVSLDCTYGGRTGIARPRHMNIEDGMQVKSRLISAGVCGENTKFVITHFSHNCNPLTENLAALERQYGVIAAYDGMEVEV